MQFGDKGLTPPFLTGAQCDRRGRVEEETGFRNSRFPILHLATTAMTPKNFVAAPRHHSRR